MTSPFVTFISGVIFSVLAAKSRANGNNWNRFLDVLYLIGVAVSVYALGLMVGVY